MAKKRITQYTRQRKRVTSYINRLRKRGLEIDLYFPTELELRKTGVKGTELSRLTRELKRLTPSVLKELAVPPQQIRETFKQPFRDSFTAPENISYDGSLFDRIVISGFRQNVRQFNERASNLLLGWLDRLLQTNDEHDVAIMLNDGAEAGNIVTYQIVYSQDKIFQYMSNMLDYLPEAGLLFKEEIMDAMEEEEDFGLLP